MNKKKILQLILTSTTVAGGMSLANASVEAAELNHNIINDKESIITFNDSYEGKVINVDTNLRVRDDASQESKVIGYLKKGDVCEIKAETVEWYRINFNGNEGYVDKEYVEPINKSKSAISVQRGQVVGTDNGLIVRQSASENSARLTLLKDGELVEIISKNGEWYNIKTGSTLGFVYEKYINVVEEELTRPNDFTVKGKVNEISSNLRLRLEASNDSAIVGYLLGGQEVEILDEDGDWYKVSYNEKVGYVNKEYITKVEDSDLNVPNDDIDKELDVDLDKPSDDVDKEAESGLSISNDDIDKESDANLDKPSDDVDKEADADLYISNDNIDEEADANLEVPSNNIDKALNNDLEEANDSIVEEKDEAIISYDEKSGIAAYSRNGVSIGERSITGQGTVINANEGLRVRLSASTNSIVIGHVYTGNKLDVIGIDGDWYKVKFNNTTGYVHKDYINFTKSETNMTGQGTVINANEGLRVRESASTSAGVLGHVYTGNKLDIIGLSGDWYKVKFNNTTGYVHKEYVKLNESGGAGSNNNGSTGEVSITGKGTVINSDLGLRIRQSASTDSAVLGYLYTGNEVEITGSTGLWYKIDYNGKESYVHKDYIKFTESSNSGSNNNNNNGSTGEVYVNAKGKVINANEGLRVREAANTNASVLGYVYTDNILEIVGTNGSWYKVKFRDTTGYVHKDYVEIMNATNPNPPVNNESENIKQTGEVYNTGSNLRVRESASTNSVVLGYLTDGLKVDIIGADGDWYKINYKDKVGYVSKDYIKLINDTENPVAPPVENPNTGNTSGGGSNENYINIISMGSVASSTLNIRSGAGIEFETIGSLTLNTIIEIVETSSNGWHKIKYNNGFGYVSSDYIKTSTNSSNYYMSLDQYVDMQYNKLNMTDNSGTWTTATKEEINYNMDSSNFIGDTGKYMFMELNYIDGFSLDLVNEVIEGRGILSGRGQAFLDGARKYNVNVMYLLTHARLETGNGNSTLSTGVLVTEVDGQPVEPRIVYNMYGVGAIDSDPLRGGAEYAYKQGWFTPELAIAEGASWISRNYINNAEYEQNTLYKMKWNISSSGVSWHQYASDIAWAEKQARIMAPYLEKCGVALEFDIPTFGKGK